MTKITPGGLIRQARLRQGNEGRTLTQEVLAARLDWPAHRLARTERDERSLSVKELGQLAAALSRLDVREVVRAGGES